MADVAFVYTPRQPTAGVLYEVVRRHLRTFLAIVAERTCPDVFDPFLNDADGDGVPDACDAQSCSRTPVAGCRSPGDGKTTIKLTGKGELLDMPSLGAIGSPLVAQLVNNSTGVCFDARYDAPYAAQTDAQLKAKGGPSGVVATTTTTLPPCPDADDDGVLDAACGGLDCYDANAQANPAQTGYFTVHRGDGSFDYDCNDTEDRLFGGGDCRLLPI